MSECKCSIRIKVLGDGCGVCNPAKALEYANEAITELEANIALKDAALKQAIGAMVICHAGTAYSENMLETALAACRKALEEVT